MRDTKRGAAPCPHIHIRAVSEDMRHRGYIFTLRRASHAAMRERAACVIRAFARALMIRVIVYVYAMISAVTAAARDAADVMLSVFARRFRFAAQRTTRAQRSARKKRKMLFVDATRATRATAGFRRYAAPSPRLRHCRCRHDSDDDTTPARHTPQRCRTIFYAMSPHACSRGYIP